MKILIKCLKGESISTDVNDETTVLDIKKIIEQRLKVPLVNQSLVYLGKTLQDSKKVSDYPTIQEDSKLHLVVRKPESFETILGRFLKKYYTDEHCKIIVSQFMKEFEKSVKTLSLDDLERIATAMVKDDSS